MNATTQANVEPYAVVLIKRDHRIIDELFTELGSAAPQQQAPLTRRIVKLLTIHARIEERHLYPLARQLLQDNGLVEAAEDAHAKVKVMIDTLVAVPDDERRKALLLELSENVRAHVLEEERDLLPRLTRSRADLDQLAHDLLTLKDILMQEEGLHEDDELNVRPAR
jgi:hemerythrin superfamily protein